MSTIKNLYRDERGVALIMALATLVIVSLLGAGALTLAGGTINQTVWDRSSNQAFHLAEAGFDQALARIRANGVSGKIQFTAKLVSGEASVTIEEINMFMYRVKSVGAEPNLASPKARRAVEAIITHLDPSKVFFADSAKGTILGSATFDGPLYVRDKLEVSGNAAFTGGPFFVKDDPATNGLTDPKGDLVIDGSSFMGKAGQKVYLFVEGNQPYSLNGPRLYAYDPVYTDVPDLKMPSIGIDKIDSERLSADLVIDTNGGVPDGSKALLFNKDTPDFTAPPDFTVASAGGMLKWEKLAKKLTITGKVFVDGKVEFGGVGGKKIDITYVGAGTLVANGPVYFQSSFQPDVPADWPNNAAFGLVTPFTVDVIGPNTKVYALIYALNAILFDKNLDFYGNATSQVLKTTSNPHITIQLPMKKDIPPGMPKFEAMTSISGWREVQP